MKVISTYHTDEFQVIDRLLPYLDLVIFDIKQLDNEIHKKLTGVNNDRILKNLDYLNSVKMNIVIQVALIPSFNDSIKNMKNIIRLIQSLPSVEGLSLLSYHTLGVTKYRNTGRVYPLSNHPQASSEYLEEKKQFFQQHGVSLVQFNG